MSIRASLAGPIRTLAALAAVAVAIPAIAQEPAAWGTEREVEGAMREFMRVALERDPRSLAFLDEVRSHHAAHAAPA